MAAAFNAQHKEVKNPYTKASAPPNKANHTSINPGHGLGQWAAGRYRAYPVTSSSPNASKKCGKTTRCKTANKPPKIKINPARKRSALDGVSGAGSVDNLMPMAAAPAAATGVAFATARGHFVGYFNHFARLGVKFIRPAIILCAHRFIIAI